MQCAPSLRRSCMCCMTFIVEIVGFFLHANYHLACMTCIKTFEAKFINDFNDEGHANTPSLAWLSLLAWGGAATAASA